MKKRKPDMLAITYFVFANERYIVYELKCRRANDVLKRFKSKRDEDILSLY